MIGSRNRSRSRRISITNSSGTSNKITSLSLFCNSNLTIHRRKCRIAKKRFRIITYSTQMRLTGLRGRPKKIGLRRYRMLRTGRGR